MEALDERVTALEDAPSGGAAASQRPISTFYFGGSIYGFQVEPTIGGYASYGFTGGAVSVGGADFALLYSPAGGTYPVRIDYEADRNCTCSIRKRSAAGAWSTLRTETLSIADISKAFEVELAAGEALGLHIAPIGGAVTFDKWEIFA